METGVADEEACVATHKEEIEALPTFREVTGLEPVEAGMTMYVVPLRSGEAKAAYFDETATAATPASVGDKTQKLLEFIDGRVSHCRSCLGPRCRWMGRWMWLRCATPTSRISTTGSTKCACSRWPQRGHNPVDEAVHCAHWRIEVRRRGCRMKSRWWLIKAQGECLSR